jgi:hypothetical protein
MYNQREYAEAGGLISYGPSQSDAPRLGFAKRGIRIAAGDSVIAHRPLPSSADDIRANQQPDTNRTRISSRRLSPLIRRTIFHSSALIPKPYKGNGQAIGDLIGGHVSMMVLSLSTVLGSVKTGQLFALAVTTPERSKLLPDVPTIAESAVPAFSAAIRYGLVAPAGTPAPIVERLSRELRAAVMSEDVRERILSEGAQPLASTPAEYAAEIDSEERKWSALVKSLNLKIE